jgi:hypothetical protein
MRELLRYLRSERGTTAAEFALVVLPFIALVLSIIFGGFLLYTNTALQYATEAASRCWEVQTTVCTSGAVAGQYATSHYYGLVAANFQHPSAACGHTIQGSATFPLNIGILDLSIPLKAQACYP